MKDPDQSVARRDQTWVFARGVVVGAFVMGVFLWLVETYNWFGA